MNKYLLLRDNKQSGPYTVPEIIAIGIKPYDLVWLEGKSAAWRYPSEIEELKAHAPAVEEQPFDRFYKKPEARQADNPTAPAEQARRVAEADNHQRYQPGISVPVEQPEKTTKEEKTQTKKVYINLPAGASQNSAASQKPASTISELRPPVYPSREPATVSTFQSTTQPVTSFRETARVEDPLAGITAAYPLKTDSWKNNKMLQAALAACIVLGLISGILLFNFYRQRETLNELNTLVQQIENREKQQQAVAATLVTDAAPTQSEPAAPPVETASLVESTSEMPAPSATIDHNKAAPGKKRQPDAQPAKSSETPSVVFTENNPGERPVARREGVEQTTPPEPAESKENLFKLVNITPNQYKTGVLGGISNLKFELVNKSNVELHRVAVEVKYLGPEKKIVKRHTVYFENISPGGQSTIEVPKSNRGVSIEYTITDIKS